MATDNVMARFLFAILKQKDLKDINWEQVARDPVLPQPISNGHAARMRYSRFRNSMQGHESQRRSRTTNPKPSRVVKRKKGDKVVKSEEEDDDDAFLNSLSPTLKQENMFIAPSRIGSNNHISRAHNRLLTPCSDSETALTTPQCYSPSPAADMQTASSTGFDFARAGSAPVHEPAGFDFTRAGSAPVHEPADHWQSYAGFPVEYNVDNFTAAFNQPDQHTAEALSMHASMMEHDRSQGHGSMIKREEWDTSSVDNQHYQQAGHC